MDLVRTGSKQLIREINEALVVQEIRARGMASRTDLVRATGLSGPTVSAVVGRLLQGGLLVERETGAPTGGRPPVMLAIRPEAGYVIGIKLTDRQVIGVLADLTGAVTATCAVSLGAKDSESVCADIAVAAQMLTPAAAGRPILGLGAGLAGIVDSETGVVRRATFFDWIDIPLGDEIAARTGIPAVVDNDVNTLVVAEQLWGAGRGTSDFVLASVGRGVGMGLVLGDRLHRGAYGGAGEFGHIKVTGGGLCECGAHGCLESLVGEPALLRAIGTAGFPRLTIDDAADRAREGDETLRAVFGAVGTALGRALATVVDIVDPDRVALAGEGMRYHDLFLTQCRTALQDNVFGSVRRLDLIVVQSDDTAWARGAASLILGTLFRPHLHHGDSQTPSLISRFTG